MLEKLKFIVEPDSPTINMTQAFDAPRKKVFEAWTRPEHVSQWWDPSGTPLALCEIDLRPRGAFRWVHRSTGGRERSFAGTYLEISAPERLVFRVHDAAEESGMLSTIDFQEHEGRTTLRMTISCPSIEARDALLEMRIDVGTAKTLENLARYLPTMM